MHTNRLLSVLFFVMASLVVMANQMRAEESGIFKINKLNLIWNKAQHSLGPNKLKDLKSDLSKHEQDELNLKKMKAHNNDKDGSFEAAVRRKLLSIMTKYSIEKYFDDVHPQDETKKDTIKSDVFKDTTAPTFRDAKLDKLWKKAEKSGFTQEQLMILHEEFQHQQEKLDDHYEVMNKIEEHLGKLNQVDAERENSLYDSDQDAKVNRKRQIKPLERSESAAEKKARLDENAQQVLREKHSNLKQGYEQLHSKITTGVLDESNPFVEEPVNELWSEALKSKFSESELESLKEELSHYQVRIQKLKHFQYELERDRIGVKDSKSNYEEDDQSRHLRKRVKELTRKVEKSHKALNKKIKGSRDEL